MRVLQIIALVLATLAATSAAIGPIIIDVDGSVESMAALATLVTHTNSAGNIALVTVTGTAWGTLTAVENNVRAFLKLAGREDILVGIGTSSTLSDAPGANAVAADSTAAGGSCDDSRLFPATPAMAMARGLNRSQYDEDDLYGAADALPAPTNYGTKSKESTAQMSTIYNQLANNVRVSYIAVAGLTNLARFLSYGNANAISTMLSRTDVHIFENGNNLCIDATATKIVFDKVPTANPITATLYTPSMLSSVRFSQTSWNSLKLEARSSGAKAQVAWLFKALEGRKNAVDGGIDANSQLYFTKDGSMRAAFVVMAVVDTATITAGKNILTGTNDNRKLIIYNSTVNSVEVGISSLTLSGNNVTRGGFLNLIPYPTTGTIVITASASELTSGQSVSMVDTFWTQWRNIMLP